ncbi:MAG: flagellar basal body P-ring formation chaperone FlgA [Pseudomonadota bacterium]
MKKLMPRWLIASLFALGMVIGAQEGAARDVIVDDDVVRLGDLFSIESSHQAMTPVAKAPAPGRQVTVSPKWLKRLAASHGVVAPDAGPLTVRRLGSTLTSDDLLTVIRQALADETGLDNVEIRLDGGSTLLTVAGTDDPTLSVENLRFDPTAGRFAASLIAAKGGDILLERALTGSVVTMVEMPVLSRALQSGTMIGANDLTMVTLASDDIAPNTMTDANRLIGMVADRSLRAGRPILEHQVAQPLLVKRGTLITMQFRQGALTINARGRALVDGSFGQSVRVLNIDSGRTIEARVVGPDTVEMTPTPLGVQTTAALTR